MARKSLLNVEIVRFSPRPTLLHKVYRAEVIDGLIEVGEGGVLEYKNIVDGWDDPPGFRLDVQAGRTKTIIRIFPTGSKEAKTKFYSIDRGTRTRSISPKTKRFLFFQWGGYRGSYQGTTRVNPTSWGNTVTIDNESSHIAKIVKEHRIEARKFDEVIDPEIRKDARREIKNASARAKRKLRV